MTIGKYLNFPNFCPGFIELLVNGVNAGVMRRNGVRVIDGDVVLNGKLFVQLHPLDEERRVVKFVRFLKLIGFVNNFRTAVKGPIPFIVIVSNFLLKKH